MKKTIKLKNCYDEITEVTLNLDNISCIIVHELSGDLILTAFDLEGNEVKYVDSDTHNRNNDWWGGYEVIYVKDCFNKIDEYNKQV